MTRSGSLCSGRLIDARAVICRRRRFLFRFSTSVQRGTASPQPLFGAYAVWFGIVCGITVSYPLPGATSVARSVRTYVICIRNTLRSSPQWLTVNTRIGDGVAFFPRSVFGTRGGQSMCCEEKTGSPPRAQHLSSCVPIINTRLHERAQVDDPIIRLHTSLHTSVPVLVLDLLSGVDILAKARTY